WRDLAAAFVGGNIKEVCLAAVGRRPEIGAAGDIRAHPPRDLVADRIGWLRIELKILGGVVFERLAGVAIDALRPVDDLDVLHRFEELTVEAIEGVLESVTAGM